MGQTLTHGIYLPDEGERNCYAGLAANWQLLDGAVGTVAEHTSQIAGKAPAVHTHGKADITDLFNSANEWTRENTFSADCIIYNSDNSGSVAGLKLRNSKAEVLSSANTSSSQLITFRDKNDFVLGYIRGAVQSTSIVAKIGANAIDSSNNTVNTELQIIAFTNGTKTIFPTSDADVHLGITTHRWKSFNGLNPGMLSLADGAASNSIAVDITDWYIQDPDYPDDPTKKILDATNHIVKTTVPGWLHIIFPNVAGNWAYARQYAAGVNMDLQRIADGVASSDFANIDFIFPIYSSCYVRIKAKTATVRIFPCLGNV